MSLWDFIKEKMQKNPKQTIGENDSFLTYEELMISAERFSDYLTSEKICAIYCHSEFLTGICVLACLAARVTAVPLSPRYGWQHTEKILQKCKPTCLITDLEGDIGIYHITDSDCEFNREDLPAFIIWTSGTTGSPKGAMLDEANILAVVKGISGYFRLTDDDSILISRPLYHIAVLTGEFITALVKGTKIVFYSERFNPSDLFYIIKEKQITTFCSTPTLLSLMASFRKMNALTSVKYITVSGECLNKPAAKMIRECFPNAKIFSGYGLTEAAPRVSVLPDGLFDSEPECAGFPLPSVKLSVRDKEGKPMPFNTPGILWIKGDNVMRGYYKDDALTKEKMSNGWLCTGDIAVIDRNGKLYIKGRVDDLIIRAGMNIYPREIEAALKTDKRTKEVLVYGIKRKDSTDDIGMKISGTFGSVDEVRRLCVKLLPSFQVPTKIDIVDDIPKNGSGKIIRRQYG